MLLNIAFNSLKIVALVNPQKQQYLPTLHT